jgi:PAS domain S-box-containing protein
MPNQLWTAKPDGTVDWVNERAIEFFGTPELHSAGDDWLATVHPDDRATAGRTFNEALRNGSSYETEFRARRHDGVYRWFLARAIPVRDADNNIERWVGTNTDIHEQKMAEAASTRERERSWSLSPVLKVIATADGRVLAVNPAWTSTLGWTGAESVGRPVGEFQAPEEHEDDAFSMVRLALGRTMTDCQTTFRTKSSERRCISWTTMLDGDILYGFGRDVTAERQAAAALAASRAERDRIWSTTNDLMAVAGQDGYLKSVNPAWSRLLGHDETTLLGRAFLDLVDPADRPRVVDGMARLANGERLTDFEDRLIHANGERSLIAWSAEPMGETFYIVGRNVTEQRAAEDALRQSQKMEAVGQLTGGIAHDFNNLLQGITGSLDLLQKRLAQGRLGDLGRFIAGAMGAAERAAALTHRLLAFSRRQPLDPKPISANPLIVSMEDLLRRTMGERVELELILDPDLWPTLCDPHQLENAVLNLAINGRDAMPDGGRLVIETSNRDLDEASADRPPDMQPGAYVCIAVTDTGIGMTQETMDRAFEPFFTTKPLGQGTGLGLSMIYGFVRQSGGTTKIRSQRGQGTSVTLYLPRCDSHLAQDPLGNENPATPPRADGETVLVIEDEPAVRALIVEVLADLGYAALEAADGPSGLEVLQSAQRVDLLVTDVGLPGLNGRQVADAARLVRPGLKIIFMTGYAENAASARGFLEPGMTMITKPFPMDVLAEKIRAIIEDGRHGVSRAP